jgi:hypothetical protein
MSTPLPVDPEDILPDLPPEVAEVIGDNLVFMAEAEEGEPAGSRMLMQMPFARRFGTPESLVMPESIVAYRLGMDGEIDLIVPSLFDESTSQVRFIGLTGEYYMISTNEIKFTDIPPELWSYNAVGFAAARRLFSGVGENMFAPQTDMNRAMFVAVLCRLDRVDESLYTVSPFTDVGINTWYGPSIAWAMSEGIISERMIADGLFDPTASITREEMAVIFNNYLSKRDYPITTINVPHFDDAHEASYWARDAIFNMRRHTIIGGTGFNMYEPQRTATRAEVAQRKSIQT